MRVHHCFCANGRWTMRVPSPASPWPLNDLAEPTLLWIIWSLPLPHRSVTEPTASAMLPLEHPQPPSNGICMTIGRWLRKLASLHTRGSQFSVIGVWTDPSDICKCDLLIPTVVLWNQQWNLWHDSSRTAPRWPSAGFGTNHLRGSNSEPRLRTWWIRHPLRRRCSSRDNCRYFIWTVLNPQPGWWCLW